MGDSCPASRTIGRGAYTSAAVAAMVTAPSRYLQEQLQPFRRDIVLLPNALDLTHYTYRLRSSVRPNLIWLRAFHDIYNPTMRGSCRDTKTVLSISHANHGGPDKSDGSLERVRKLVQDLSLDEAIELPGRIPKFRVPHIINRHDIFLNTTNADNTR